MQARATATPQPPASPSNSRTVTSSQPSDVTAHTPDVIVNAALEASIMPRRPRLSLIGPSSSCPNATPMMNAVIVSCATVAVVCRDRCIAGSAAR